MSGLKPTRQRIDLAGRIIGADRHFTAEDLHAEAGADGMKLSVGTVYNTLRQFERVGLVRELALDGIRAVYDTDTSRHHHFYVVGEDSIIDIPAGTLVLQSMPSIPKGYDLSRVEVIVRLRRLREEGPG